MSKEGHDFPYKFQHILEKVENDRDQLPFICEENNYSKRSYGLFRCKSSLIMTSVQDFFHILFLGSFPEGGPRGGPPTDQNRVYKRPDQNRVKKDWPLSFKLFEHLLNDNDNNNNLVIRLHLRRYTSTSGQNNLADKTFGGQYFWRTKFSAASQIFGSFVRRNCVR